MNLFIRELRKLLALTKADPKSLAAGIIAPTVILVIFALTFGNFVALKLAVVNDDAGGLGASFQETVFSQTSPLSGTSSPPHTLSRVDLPHPDLPSTNTMPFSGKETDTPSSARVSPAFVR